MSRLDEVKDFISKQPTHISDTNEKCIAKIELMKLHVLQDIDLSLAYMVDIFIDNLELNEVKNQEEKPKEKKPVEKTCETCMCDPNCKADVAMACGHCYDYSEWEGL